MRWWFHIPKYILYPLAFYDIIKWPSLLGFTLAKHQFFHNCIQNNGKKCGFLCHFQEKFLSFLNNNVYTITFLPIYHCNVPLLHKHVSYILQKRNNTKTKNTIYVLSRLYWEIHQKVVQGVMQLTKTMYNYFHMLYWK